MEVDGTSRRSPFLGIVLVAISASLVIARVLSLCTLLPERGRKRKEFGEKFINVGRFALPERLRRGGLLAFFSHCTKERGGAPWRSCPLVARCISIALGSFALGMSSGRTWRRNS